MRDEPVWEKIQIIATSCLVSEGLPLSFPIQPAEGIKLLGPHAICDSLGLVSYLVALEMAINAEFEAQITLINEQAMSQTRSPFRNLAVLTEYIAKLLAAE